MLIGIFGTSGLAREFADVADAMGEQSLLIGVRDDEVAEINQAGIYKAITEVNLPKHRDSIGGYVIGIGDNKLRNKISEKYSGLPFTNLIHPTASFGRGQKDSVSENVGVIICAGCRITNNISLGNHNILNLNCTVGHDCILGDYVNLAPGANISGNVVLGNGVYVGTGTQIINGSPHCKLIVEDEIVIGAGAVVTKCLSEKGTYVGIPAKKL